MNRIRTLRLEQGISMKEAARRLEIPYTTYVNYEKGDREPNSDMLIRLSGFYNCSVDYLIGNSSQREDGALLEQVMGADPQLLEMAGNLYEAGQIQSLLSSGRTAQAQALLAAHVGEERAAAYIQLQPCVSDADPQLETILTYAGQLNAQGLERLSQYAEDLAASGKYQKAT